MRTDFLCRIENQVTLTKSILTERKCYTALKKGGLSPKEISDIGLLIIECREVINQASLFPDVGEG